MPLTSSTYSSSRRSREPTPSSGESPTTGRFPASPRSRAGCNCPMPRPALTEPSIWFRVAPHPQNATYLLGTPQLTLFPELVCDPAKGLKPGYFANPSCFKPQPAGKLGDASIPYLPGPMYWNSDLAVSKKFKITERKELEFRASAFNFMNHGLLSFTNGDSNLQLQLNDLGQVITEASNALSWPQLMRHLHRIK